MRRHSIAYPAAQQYEAVCDALAAIPAGDEARVAGLWVERSADGATYHVYIGGQAVARAADEAADEILEYADDAARDAADDAAFERARHDDMFGA